MADSSLGFINPDLLTNCTVATCPIVTSFYNYRISLAPNVTFLALFSLAVPWFAGVWLYTRRGFWFMTAMLFGLAAEIIGYIGRIISYNDQWNPNGFLIMSVCLTLGPAFFSAAIYLCLGRIVVIYGSENSRFAPLMYTKIFIPCDMVAMILQAAGGAMAVVALDSNKTLRTADDIITAGLSSQVVTLYIFMILCIDFGLKVRRRRHKLGDETALSRDPLLKGVRSSKSFRYFLFALGLATILIFWRCCYRVAELNQGFLGPVTFKQNLFIGFEGILMVLTVSVLAVFHPALCMGEAMNRSRPTTLTSGSQLGRFGGMKKKLMHFLPIRSSAKPGPVQLNELTKEANSRNTGGVLVESSKRT